MRVDALVAAGVTVVIVVSSPIVASTLFFLAVLASLRQVRIETRISILFFRSLPADKVAEENEE